MIGNASNRFGVRVDSVDVDVAELLAAGVVLVGAAGNYYQTLDVLGGPDYDNYFNQTSTPKYYMRGGSPPSAAGVICVGNVSTAADTPEEKNSSSESGPRVDVWAPGTNIVSTCSTTNAFGATTAYPFNASYLIMSISGTSMASPQVAGVLACALEIYPGMKQEEAKAYIVAYAKSGQLTATSGGPTDAQDLQGAPNKFLYYYQERATSGNTFPKINFKQRPTTGSVYPRTRIRRT
jgi:subtilisin family serine protease